MRKPPLSHDGNGHSGHILASATDEGYVRLEIVPMSDRPFVDMTLSQLVQYVHTIKVRFQTGEL